MSLVYSEEQQLLADTAAEFLMAKSPVTAQRKLRDKNLDLIVANDVANPAIGFNSEDNAVTVIDRGLHEIRFEQTSKGKIARQLIALISTHLKDTAQNHA